MSENLDLLGDPIPEGFGGRGRPPHIPTRQNRNKVMLLQAIGWTEPRIAHALSITKPTLRKHYFREMRVRDEARDRVDASVLARCYDEAMKGNVGAIKEFGRMLNQSDLMTMRITHPRDEPKPAPLGKKAQAHLDAEGAHVGSSWADLLDDEQAEPRPN